jgi:hypothetical protein
MERVAEEGAVNPQYIGEFGAGSGIVVFRGMRAGQGRSPSP